MKKFIKSALAAIAIFSMAATASAQAPTVPTDSVSEAFATIVYGQMGPAIGRQFAGDDTSRKTFLEGIQKSFTLTPEEYLQYRAIAEGINLRMNLEQLRDYGFPVDDAKFIEAFTKIMGGESVGFTPETAEQYMTAIMDAKEAAANADQAAFVAAAAAREGAVTTPSGLVFEVITEGEGDHPKASDRVEVLYEGSLADGTVFDKRDTPITFNVGNLIPGFTEGLQLMKPGGTYRLTIPAEIGYGNRGAGDVIKPGGALQFVVTLVNIKPEE